MDIQKLFFPVTVVAAIAGIYVFLRGAGTQDPQVTTPNTASSGVPATYSDGGIVQGAYYDVNQSSANPSIFDVLSQPGNANPGSSDGSAYPPAYLAYNFGPSHDLTKPMVAPSGAGGCNCGLPSGSDGVVPNPYPDGNGLSPLSSSRGLQIYNSDSAAWLPDAIQNVMSYMALERGAPAIPTLVTTPQSGSLN